MIQQKINNKEGMLIILKDGKETKISAKELDQKTDPKWDKTIDDYKTQIDDIKNGENIINEENNNLKSEIEDLELNEIELRKEYESQEINDLLLELDIDRKEILDIKEQNEMFQKKMKIQKLENRIKFLYDCVTNKIKKNKNEIKSKQLKIEENNKNIEIQMQYISEDLKKTRKAQNKDYKLWLSYPTIWKPTKDDYKTELKDGLVKEEMTKKELENPDNYNLVLLTDQERIEKAKEKKKKEIAIQLNTLYPERLIDGTMQTLYNEKVIEIDALGLNENLTINEKLAEIKLYSL